MNNTLKQGFIRLQADGLDVVVEVVNSKVIMAPARVAGFMGLTVDETLARADGAGWATTIVPMGVQHE